MRWIPLSSDLISSKNWVTVISPSTGFWLMSTILTVRRVHLIKITPFLRQPSFAILRKHAFLKENGNG